MIGDGVAKQQSSPDELEKREEDDPEEVERLPVAPLEGEEAIGSQEEWGESKQDPWVIKKSTKIKL